MRQGTGGLLSLDVRALKRAGALRPDAVCSVSWSDGGTIVTRMDRAGDCLTLEYRTRRYGDSEWTPHSEPVRPESTPCHYGGERVWFTCPGCHSRRAVLHGVAGAFYCRRCHDLAYESTREDTTERANRRIVALQRRLQAPADCDPWQIPPKPPGMHWQTYERLAFELHAVILRREALFGVQCEALRARSEGLLAREGRGAWRQGQSVERAGEGDAPRSRPTRSATNLMWPLESPVGLPLVDHSARPAEPTAPAAPTDTTPFPRRPSPW